MSLPSLITQCLGARDAVSLAREEAQCWEAWLAPISADSPVGEDPGYDDDFQRMRDEVNKLSGGDVEQVIRWAEKLITRTCKDLRVATYYLWARLHRDGEAGLADGVSVLAALVERYAADILPARSNTRKMALEWVASSKVLDSLSLYPEVMKGEAERTVAALAWLEQSLEAWPEDQRPALGALYAALSSRLVQGGGVDALVPQTRGSQPLNGPTSASTAAAICGEDLLLNGYAMATYLRTQPLGWLAAHRLMKSLLWDTTHQAPVQDASGNTHLIPPRSDQRAQLKRLYLQQSWSELLDQIEKLFTENANHVWLDLQWYLYQALSKQPTPQDSWADIVKRDLGMFLERLPGLEALRWSDGTPFADETTREWISQHVSGNRPQSWLPVPVAASNMADAELFSLESEALAQADSDGVEQALAWLVERPSVQTGRQRWLLRLLMARVAEQHGKSDLAVHLLGELDATAHRHALAEWEPELNFEVKARLLKLLRLKAQRNEADRPALTQRMEALLAALVAIDPVQAAVLCG